MSAKRVCQLIKLNPQLRQNIAQSMRRCGQLLIANFKYCNTGSDYEADMKKTLVDGAEGSGKEIPWWAEAEEVFRFEGKA
ncbi:hypothetical protein DFH08DRAFT_959188 [Mycena albidolilacea]|uniref:Uncharacterized protein n=1 Tax=Mycena albidolilacea TaxID=1033008 RepID=A0AAD7A3S9_9AGAR|nr:hypothetical protein DFH08DRAFT_959188 [Mycena albidolilacea]